MILARDGNGIPRMLVNKVAVDNAAKAFVKKHGLAAHSEGKAEEKPPTASKELKDFLAGKEAMRKVKEDSKAAAVVTKDIKTKMREVIAADSDLTQVDHPVVALGYGIGACLERAYVATSDKNAMFEALNDAIDKNDVAQLLAFMLILVDHHVYVESHSTRSLHQGYLLAFCDELGIDASGIKDAVYEPIAEKRTKRAARDVRRVERAAKAEAEGGSDKDIEDAANGGD
jgi:hypothetical protein